MLCYSSDEFRQDWRYAVDQEFATSDGKPFPYAPGGHQGWGEELAKIPLEGISEACVSSDGNRIAVAVDDNVYVFDTTSQERITVLKGHLEEISSIAFQPHNANILVTSSREKCKRAGGKTVVETDALIIIWQLDDHTLAIGQKTEIPSFVINSGALAVASKLAERDIALSPEGVQELEELLAPSVQHVVKKHLAAGKTRIHGTISTSFGSNAFSPSGRFMVYTPGNSPRSNDIDNWDMCICRTNDFTTPVFTLSGHTDGIMWQGWNRDESLFASVSWDNTVRIWDATSGEAIRVFLTTDKCQNWTGAFSPDSNFFAATDGSGRVHIYNLAEIRTSEKEGLAKDEAHWVYLGMKEYDGWRRTVAWHPNSKWLAVGKDQGDELLLLDVEEKKVLQKRTLSTAAARVDREELRVMLKRQPGVSQVQFADSGNKIIAWTHGDDSIEVFDIKKEQKWRFGRGGTDDIPGAEAWRDENGKVTSPHGLDMLVWEKDSRLQMASIDGDGIRFWAIGLD